MSDYLQKIADICDTLRSDIGYTHSPRVVRRADFDLSKFDAQESGIPGIVTEYVNQSGPGICGDDFTGVMAFPLGDHLFVIEYAT